MMPGTLIFQDIELKLLDDSKIFTFLKTGIPRSSAFSVLFYKLLNYRKTARKENISKQFALYRLPLIVHEMS